MEPIIPFNNQSGSPLCGQIHQYIRNKVRRGKLEAESRLPSTHMLARNLRLSRSTTQMVYDQPLSERYIEALLYKGYFVYRIEELVEIRQKGGGSSVESRDTGKDHYEVNFFPREIDLDSFPFNARKKISRNTLIGDNKEMFATGDPREEKALRIAIGDYLYPTREMDCRPEQTLTGAGNEYLLVPLPQILGNGRKTVIENPTYKQAYRVLRGERYPVIPMDMDRYGAGVKRLAYSSADVTCVMPSHQYPTGVVMPVKRRQELLVWAYNSTDRYLIEDDYDSKFRYKGKPIPVLQGMDRGGHVIYIGTFSESIAPAIRAGFMMLPGHLLETYRERAGFYLSTVSRIDQNILYQLITQGYYERHLNRMRALYKGKHDALMTELKELEGWFLTRGGYAGLHVLLTHRQREAEGRLVVHAVTPGVKVYGISGCFIQSGANLLGSIVMLECASFSEEEIRESTRLLAKTRTL